MPVCQHGVWPPAANINFEECSPTDNVTWLGFLPAGLSRSTLDYHSRQRRHTFAKLTASPERIARQMTASSRWRSSDVEKPHHELACSELGNDNGLVDHLDRASWHAVRFR